MRVTRSGPGHSHSQTGSLTLRPPMVACRMAAVWCAASIRRVSFGESQETVRDPLLRPGRPWGLGFVSMVPVSPRRQWEGLLFPSSFCDHHCLFLPLQGICRGSFNTRNGQHVFCCVHIDVRAHTYECTHISEEVNRTNRVVSTWPSPRCKTAIAGDQRGSMEASGGF